MNATEKPVRHTERCVEAMACGHPAAFCVCTPGERQHDDWEALSDVLQHAQRSLGGFVSALAPIARSIPALREMHDRVAALIRAERDDDPDSSDCPACKDLEGP